MRGLVFFEQSSLTAAEIEKSLTNIREATDESIESIRETLDNDGLSE
jgi:hypothetical protein